MRKGYLVGLIILGICTAGLVYFYTIHPNPIGMVYVWIEGMLFGHLVCRIIYDQS